MPSLCTLTGVVYDQTGAVAVGARLTLTPLSVTGLLMSEHARTIRTNAAGEIKEIDGTPVIEVQGTTLSIVGDVLGFTTAVTVTIPSSGTATLESLAAIITYPTTGLTVKEEGTALATLIGTINFVGTGVTAVQASAGVATVTITGQPLDAELSALAGLTSAADSLPYFTGLGTAGLTTLTAYGRTLIGAVDASAGRSTLGLGTLATQNGTFSGTSSGSNTGDQSAASLGLVIGTDVQAWDAELDSVAAIGSALQQIRVNAGGNALEYFTPAAAGVAWGGITGTLSDQTDLQTALDAKANLALSNLVSVDINTSLLFQATAGVGSAAKPALNAFIGSTTQYESIVQTAGLITHAALGSATNISIVMTPKGTGGLLLSAASNPVLIKAGQGTVFSSAGLALRNSADSGFLGLDVGALGARDGIGLWDGTNYYFLLNTANAFLGRAGMLVKWSDSTTNAAGGTVDLTLGRNAASILAIDNGTAGRWAGLKAGFYGAATNTVANGITIGTRSSGTPAAGLGAGLLHTIDSSTTANQEAAQFKAAWQVATHASRVAYAGIATNLMGSTTLIDRIITGPRTALVDATATSLFDIALPTLTGASGVIDVTIYATNGTDVQVRSQVIRYSAINKAAAYQTEIVIVSEAASVSTGTLTAAWTIVTGTNLVTIKVNADTSLASTTSFYCTYTLRNNSDQAITIY